MGDEQGKGAIVRTGGCVGVADKYILRFCVSVLFAGGGCVWVSFFTAQRAITFDGAVTSQTLLIVGGAGAVGHHAIQMAKVRGAYLLTTISSPGRGHFFRVGVAIEASNYRTENVVERIAALTDGHGADRSIELNLSANAPLYDRILAPGGTVIIYGTDAPMASLPAQAFISRAGRRSNGSSSMTWQMPIATLA